MEDRALLKQLDAILLEDVGPGDITSQAAPNRRVRAVIDSTAAGYVSGIRELKILFAHNGIRAKAHVLDGAKISKGQTVFTLEGRVRDLLPVERAALNILFRMSGITTLTRKYVGELKKVKSKARVAATRKSAPGLMRLDKKAVLLGGGITHRMGLYDMFLIKDNHLKVFGGDIAAAVAAARKHKPKVPVEVEVVSSGEALKAAAAGADMILLDNMKPVEIRRTEAALKKAGLRRGVLLEVSGGVSLENIREYGKAGADWISIGRLTHSAPALDFTLEIVKVL
jgi:nicotinate-nucleotide pyrophosphorylase (carboxylating)